MSDAFARESSEDFGDRPEEFVPAENGTEVLLNFVADEETCRKGRVGKGSLAIYDLAAVGLEFERASVGLDADKDGDGRHGRSWVSFVTSMDGALCGVGRIAGARVGGALAVATCEPLATQGGLRARRKCCSRWRATSKRRCNAGLEEAGGQGAVGAPAVRALRQDQLPPRLAVPGDGVPRSARPTVCVGVLTDPIRAVRRPAAQMRSPAPRAAVAGSHSRITSAPPSPPHTALTSPVRVRRNVSHAVNHPPTAKSCTSPSLTRDRGSVRAANFRSASAARRRPIRLGV